LSLRNSAIVVLAAIGTAPCLAQAPEQWQASWVWGSKNEQQGPGYFRMAFVIQGEVEVATLQGSGDDGYTLFVNGEKARESGFGFNRTDVTDVRPYLVQGRNVIAALCQNCAFPGGFLAQLQIVYTDGREQLFVSDRDTRFWHEEQAGWNEVDFDDAGWEACRELSRPPGGAWGPLPLQYAGRRAQLKLLSIEVPESVRAGESVSVRATVLPTAPLTRDESVSVRLLRGDGTVGSVVQAPDRPTTSWVPGQAVDLGPIPVPVNLFTASGTIELEFGLTRSAFEGLGNAVRREVDVQGREGTVSPTPARVGDLGGAPALFIGGRPAVPMMYLQGRTPVPAEYGQMARAGYRVFSLSIDMGWRGEGVYDYADTDHRIISALEQAQDAYVIPRVEVTAPAWWCDAHPEETVGCADGTHWVEDDFGGTKHQSFASELWRSEAAEALVKLIEHFRESPYADRVVGYHIASGIYGEWHLWSPSHLPDVSEPMRQAFIGWCRGKYGDNLEKLNAAWGTELGSFEEITCATREERLSSDLGVFLDLKRSCRVPDYWRCLHEASASAVGHFCRVVKEATGGDAVTGAFFSYQLDIDWPQEGGHLEAHRAFSDPNIDFFSSPHSYSHRALGQEAAFRAYVASIQAHGKLFIDEGDDRTHLSGDKPYMHTENTEQDIAIMRRETLNALTNRVGLWWFDMTSGWFNDPELLKAAGELHELGERTLTRPRESYAEIAVVYDPTNYYGLTDWIAGKDALCLPLCNEQAIELQRIGAPYDVLLLQDALAPGARDYRCYVFCNTWHMSRELREQVQKRLQGEGRTLVFAYAPGFSSEGGLDIEGMRQLTGMDFELDEAGGPLRAQWTEDAGGIDGLAARAEWGTDRSMAPRFRVTDPEAMALADWADGSGTAAAAAIHDGWTSVYCGTAPIPAALLADSAARAGVHLWTDSWRTGANLWAGNGLVGVHTAAEGPVRFDLPWEATVTDAITGTPIAAGTRSFEVELPKWTTAIYSLQRQ